MCDKKIAVIGLGYVGLPLAHAFSFKYSVIGFDINTQRVKELTQCRDSTLELSEIQVRECIDNNTIFTSQTKKLESCNFYIITVPTPIDCNNLPDLAPLLSATRTVAQVLKKGDIVVYESTVYPGATEEECVPILEKISKLKFNKDFFCGYSPERINPGDKEHTLKNITKITSGSTKKIALVIDSVYSDIIDEGTYLASSIKVAEAAKVIENSQRDINIAFMNELAMIFEKMEINTREVIDAASTKWNFLKFEPGLVGGHCIGVDPYYLTFKAKKLGHESKIILAGREINDGMALYAASRILKLINQNSLDLRKVRILILGVTFKENCPDIRNSKVFDLYKELASYGCNVDATDCYANENDVLLEHGIKLIKNPILENFEILIFAVPHKEYFSLETSSKHIVFDLKACRKSFTDRL